MRLPISYTNSQMYFCILYLQVGVKTIVLAVNVQPAAMLEYITQAEKKVNRNRIELYCCIVIVVHVTNVCSLFCFIIAICIVWNQNCL